MVGKDLHEIVKWHAVGNHIEESTLKGVEESLREVDRLVNAPAVELVHSRAAVRRVVTRNQLSALCRRVAILGPQQFLP